MWDARGTLMEYLQDACVQFMGRLLRYELVWEIEESRGPPETVGGRQRPSETIGDRRRCWRMSMDAGRRWWSIGEVSSTPP